MQSITRSFIERTFSLFITLFVLFWASIPIHEAFHYLAAKSLGVQTTINLNWEASGTISFDTIPTKVHRDIISLAGGIGTGLLFSFLWYVSCKQMKHTIWEIDNSFSFCLLSLYQFFYTPLDYFNLWQNQFLILIISLLAISVSFIIYGKKLITWLFVLKE